MFKYIPEILSLQKNNKHTAVIFENRDVSYKELYIACLQNTKCIHSSILGNIALYLPNSYYFIEAFFTAAILRRTIVPLNHKATIKEIERDLDYCDVSLVITNTQYEESISIVLHAQAKSIDIFNIETKKYIGSDRSKVVNSEISENIALLIHTSGSIGNPKRVMLTHENLITNAYSIISSLSFSYMDKTLIVLPLFLVSALTSQMLTHFILGASIVILSQPFLSSEFFRIARENQISNMTVVPSILNLITLRNDYLNRLPHLKKIGFAGAPTPRKRIQELIEYYQSIQFIHMYGQTEASARLTHLLPEDFKKKIGSVGKPIHGVKIRVVNELGDDCETFEIGEIIAHGKNVFQGYYKNLDATKETLIENWLHTGDMGYLDDEEFLYVTGRKKNVIISGGMNIYPEEIEEVISSFAGVLKARAYSVPDSILGEVVQAEIEVTDTLLRTDEVLRYCRSVLTAYKVPVEINIVDKISTTATDKIKRQIENVS